MKVKILKTCSVVVEAGSVVEVSESQFKALGDFCGEVKAEPKAAKKKEK